VAEQRPCLPRTARYRLIDANGLRATSPDAQILRRFIPEQKPLQQLRRRDVQRGETTAAE
jgi:hypothetical protein